MHLKSHWISETKTNLMEERTLGTGRGQIQFFFFFFFFSDRRTLKFLKMKCNPTNKKNCGLMR